MLEKLSFTNFKTWPKAEIEFGRITGLFGTNSSGKTSLIQFALLLKQTKEATDRSLSLALSGAYVDLGVYRDMVHQHQEANNINWELTFNRNKELELVDPSKKRKDVFVSAKQISVGGSLSSRGSAAIAESLKYTLDETQFSLKPKAIGSTDFELSTSHPDFKFIRTQGRVWKLPGPIKSYAFPDQARTYFQNAQFLSDLEAAFEEQLDGIYYLGPLREYPKRDYLWARSRPQDVGSRGEKAVDAILAATSSGEKRNKVSGGRLKPFQEMIAVWLREMGLIDDFKVEEIKEGSNRWQAKVRVRKGSPEVLLTDVGFGVSQVLPVITLLHYVPEGSTVILEQPEIHLHPLAQANLADVIINVAINRKIQVVLESHSEHFLLRLQTRIAEDVISSSDVKLYFCDAPNGVSEVRRLEIDLLGSIQNWPKNFMGDSFGETVNAELARLKRQNSTS